jgi:hypothetical protein
MGRLPVAPARTAVVALAALALAGCAPLVVVPDAERERVHAALDGQARWARVALSVSPLYGDHARLLLLDAPASEVDLVRDTAGKVIPPPPPERILPPGTPLRIETVEFATGMAIASRAVMSPRYLPWVVLRLAGEDRPCVVVLSSGAASADGLIDELDRVLTRDDPSRLYAALPKDQREAVARKELIEGDSTRAAEMAWGVPEKVRIDRPAGTEEWTWPGGRRRAWFLNDKLQRWEK